ncbi:MAG: c-type cytochrome [Phycisphaerales bacterium]
MRKTQSITALTLATLAAAGSVAFTSGCRDTRSTKPPRQFFPDMDDQPKWKNQGGSGFFADGRMMRAPVAETVPFGRVSWVRDAARPEDSWASTWMQTRLDLLRENQGMYTGMTDEGTYVERIPIAIDRALLEHGRKKYEINCSVCHGYLGDGKGTVGVQWSAPVPSYHDPKYKDAKLETGRDGYLFFVIMNGVRTMPAYGHALTEHDAWSVVAYIRAIQASRPGATGAAQPATQPTQQTAATPAGGEP